RLRTANQRVGYHGDKIPSQPTKILRLGVPLGKGAGPRFYRAPALCDVDNACHVAIPDCRGCHCTRVTRIRERGGRLGPTPAIMHFLFRLIIFFYVWGIFTAQGQKTEESTEEVKIEVLHRPENCSKTSRKGDLLNAHYDGFLAKDGSKFYCSRKQDST
uniref:FKBP prolyl isomerase 7 n=1 Tax=Sus scrofa TaxID=9823 RepID=A0A8D0RQ40_PIG